MFDGTLGKYTGSNNIKELNEGAKPYHAIPFPIPMTQYPIHKKEVSRLKEINRLIKIGVLKKINDSQWTAPTFIIPKTNGTARFISDIKVLS